MASCLDLKTFFILCFVILVYTLTIIVEIDLSCSNDCLQKCNRSKQTNRLKPWEQKLNFEGFNNETGTADGHYIVPNYVHFVRFGLSTFDFVHAVCVLAAFKNQRPEKLFIHTNLNGFHGRYWNVIMNTAGLKEVLMVKKMEVPTEIFGQQLQPFFKYFHGGDVARLEIMMKYGGIFLDCDAYIVRSLDDFRRFEMTIGWQPGNYMGNQILVAHKNARFLSLWYNSYRNNYDDLSWYYNAGVFPTNHILNQQPHLVHHVGKLFGVYNVKWNIYMTDFPEWRDYYTLHLLSRRLNLGLRDLNETLKYPVLFNEINVLLYPVAFRDLCKAVYPIRTFRKKRPSLS